MLQKQGSAIVNGQLVSQAPIVSQYVTGYAPYSAASPSGPLTIPPTMGTWGNNAGPVSATADSNAQATLNAKSDPFNPKKSPVIPAIVGLGLALFILHAVHFREGAKVSESAE